MYCKHCGEEIENDSKFCSDCGTKQKQVTGEGTKTPVLKYKRIKGVYRFFVLAILFAFFLIGFFLIKVGSHYSTTEKVVWYIGFPLAVISSLIYNHYRMKWKDENNDENEKLYEEIEKVNHPKEEPDNSGMYVFLFCLSVFFIIYLLAKFF